MAAQKNRVRHFIGLDHLLIDGAWKEAVLRAMISRTLLSRYAVASGFVITEEMTSSQIDVLIYDNAVPVLHKGGDLVFVQPEFGAKQQDSKRYHRVSRASATAC